MHVVALAVALALGGCGRVEFDVVPDVSRDAAGDPDAVGCGAPACFDPSFASGGGFTIDVGGTSNSTFGSQAIAIAPDGGIVAVGKTGPVGATDLLLVALTAEGAIDPAFTNGSGVAVVDGGFADEEALGVTFDPATSDLLVSGTSDGRGLVARFSRTGQLRATFGTGGLVHVDAGQISSGVLNGIAVDAQGRIVAAGQALFALGQFNFLVARMMSSGVLDGTFDSDGIVNGDLGGSADEFGTLGVLAADGVVVAGSSYRGITANFDGTLVALGLDGQRLGSFGTGGVTYHDVDGTDRYLTLAVDAANRFLAVGVANQDLLVARHLANGAIDPSFGTNGATVIAHGDDESLHGVVELPDGRIVAVGRTLVAGTSRPIIVILDATGAVLADYELAPTSATGLDYAVLDAEGRVLVVGDAAGVVTKTDDLFVARLVIP